ncbi:septum site-determining protein MinC [Alkalibacillus almallahensis]|uniref:septum site-determining protein MinC n=1 Tax=Alkalibacillus almallahensis TaxID=1379154 RepID=UPI00141DDC83|nr:septum site-determining protein MinC [Alkalibacillus almallahensis]NIK11242.1 septum site-determining protein MinC [Alkalibacillus almallahensis]
MTETNLYLTMKGTTEGIIVYLDDQCSFEQLLEELHKQLESDAIHQRTSIKVHTQNRLLDTQQQDEIRHLLNDQHSIGIKSFESNVISKEEAKSWYDHITLKPRVKTIRSGQELHENGDIFIIGDVNPGATVTASGSVFVLGQLRGIVHAGFPDGANEVVAASYMNPSQIRIADQLSRAPDYEVEGSQREFAFINQETGQIELDDLHNLQKIRPNLTDISERGL